MNKGKYKDFSNRLITTMKTQGFGLSRSPHGICIKTLSEFTNASEQICRRYIRGDAIPDYDKIILIASKLKVAPGWLLFGDNASVFNNGSNNNIDDDVLHYILRKSFLLYKDDSLTTDDYADFIINLIRDVREISTSKENIEKIVNLALDSISSYYDKKKNKKNVCLG